MKSGLALLVARGTVVTCRHIQLAMSRVYVAGLEAAISEVAAYVSAYGWIRSCIARCGSLRYYSYCVVRITEST